MKAFLLIHKMAALPQAREILNRYPIRQLTMLCPIEGKRMSEATFRSYGDAWLEGIDVEFVYLNLKEPPQMAQFHRLLKAGNYDLVGLPYAGGRPYFKTRRWFGKDKTFIVISDGTDESSSLMDFYKRIRIKKPLDFLNAWSKIIELSLYARADEAYSIFHPLPSCFAKKTHPAAMLDVPEFKAERIRTMARPGEPVTYVAQGYGVKFEEAVEKFKLENPVTTLKFPDDKDHIIVAEEVITVLKPVKVVGYCSDAVLFARKFLPDAECIAIMDPGTDASWGRYHNAVYRKQAQRIGDIRFVTFDEYRAM